MTVVNRIFELLEQSDLNQKMLASIIGVKQNTITRWKTGELKSYTKYLPQIAEALGTTVEYLVTGNTTTSEDAQEETESASDKDIKFALFGTADIDDDVYESVKQFAKFAAEQKRGKKKND